MFEPWTFTLQRSFFLSSATGLDTLRRVHRDGGHDRRHLPLVRHRVKHPKVEGGLRRGQSAKPVPRQRCITSK